MAKSFSITRKSGYALGKFTIEKAQRASTCGSCSKPIPAGDNRVSFSGKDFPVKLCTACVGRLIKFLKG